MRAACFAFALLSGCRAAAPPVAPERVRYLRPNGSPECTFEVAAEAGGWRIASVTGSLTVEARYGEGDALLEGRASLKGGAPARVTVAAGRASVSRTGLVAQEVDIPPGVIVTSAPDWSDVFRICRSWNRAGPARREFAGLWIHPVQPAQRLTFTAERVGVDVLDGLALDRLSIRLRGNSPYVAWVDDAGRMVKLVSLPFKPGSAVLMLEGVEASSLRPE